MSAYGQERTAWKSRAVIYQWNAWNNFLLPRLLPNSIRIDARITDRAAGVMRRVPPDSPLFAFHIDCTYTATFPFERDELTRSLHAARVRILNDGLTDISKRRLQQRCAELGLPNVTSAETGPPDELLIVKTNLNSAGLPESRLGYLDRRRLRVVLPSVIKGRDDYRVLPRKQIPPRWWRDETLVIERYITNQRGLWYRVYSWFERIVVFEGVSQNQIRRMYNAEKKRCGYYVQRPHADIVFVGGDDCAPERLLSCVMHFRSNQGCEFCSLDIMQDDDGRVFVVDLNVTPFCRDGNAGYIQFLQTGESPTTPA